MSTQNFKPVAFRSSRKSCPLPLAVTADFRTVAFRLSAELVAETKAKAGDLYSIYFDNLAALFAIVPDPQNKTGEARRMLSAAGKKDGSYGKTLKLTFPRTDLLAKIWKDEAKIAGLSLFEGRAPGKIVFHAPAEKIKTD